MRITPFRSAVAPGIRFEMNRSIFFEHVPRFPLPETCALFSNEARQIKIAWQQLLSALPHITFTIKNELLSSCQNNHMDSSAPGAQEEKWATAGGPMVAVACCGGVAVGARLGKVRRLPVARPRAKPPAR